MGFFFVAAWAGSALLLGGPATVVTCALTAKSGDRRIFLPILVLVAGVAAGLRVSLLVDAHVSEGTLPVWPTLYAMLFHVPLLVSVPLGAAGLLGLRLAPSPAREIVTGLGAGIAASVPLQLTLPFYFGRLIELLGMRAGY